jgi:hypothetical protein
MLLKGDVQLKGNVQLSQNPAIEIHPSDTLREQRLDKQNLSFGEPHFSKAFRQIA